jgi:hypothetical protein
MYAFFEYTHCTKERLVYKFARRHVLLHLIRLFRPEMCSELIFLLSSVAVQRLSSHRHLQSVTLYIGIVLI